MKSRSAAGLTNQPALGRKKQSRDRRARPKGVKKREEELSTKVIEVSKVTQRRSNRQRVAGGKEKAESCVGGKGHVAVAFCGPSLALRLCEWRFTVGISGAPQSKPVNSRQEKVRGSWVVVRVTKERRLQLHVDRSTHPN
ncbi:hypothetical protein NW759_000561 [Fusarium solani]|nr:hypothetical protein NW759_000561 [Fusarium solani]